MNEFMSENKEMLKNKMFLVHEWNRATIQACKIAAECELNDLMEMQDRLEEMES